jgi:hypothetical protein
MTNSARNDGELAEIQTVGIEGIEKEPAAEDYSNAPGAIPAIHANSSRTSSLLERGWISAQRSR